LRARDYVRPQMRDLVDEALREPRLERGSKSVRRRIEALRAVLLFDDGVDRACHVGIVGRAKCAKMLARPDWIGLPRRHRRDRLQQLAPSRTRRDELESQARATLGAYVRMAEQHRRRNRRMNPAAEAHGLDG